MNRRLSITRRRRIFALAGVALVSLPLVLGPAVRSFHAHSAEIDVALSKAPGSLADVIEADKPAVVTVMTKAETAEGRQGAPQFGPGSSFDEFFRQFFGQNAPMLQPKPGPSPMRRPVEHSLGSGFIIASDGTIVTNNHVIDGASEIKVILDDGTEHVARLVGRDAKTDLAVLRIDAGRALPTLAWGNSDGLRAGDAVVAIGNPFGIGTTATSGIVSARGRDLHNGPYDDFIQIDAAINHGNSGGPLIDMQGHVIGINTAIYSPNGGNVGVGFAIPSNDAEGVVATLMRDGSIAHGYLGVRVQPVTQDVADALGLGDRHGALVASVEPGSPAASGGVEAGDVILSLDGSAIAAPRDLSRKVADLKPGTAKTLDVWRNGKQIAIPVAIGDGNAAGSAPMAPSMTGEADVPELGMALATNPLGGGGALVASLDPAKAAAAAGLAEGDIIEAVNQQDEPSPQDVATAIREAAHLGRKSVLLQVERDGEQMFVAVPFQQG